LRITSHHEIFHKPMNATEVPRLPFVEDTDNAFFLGDCSEFSPRFRGDKFVDPLTPLIILHEMGRRCRVCYFTQFWYNVSSQIDEVGLDFVKVPEGYPVRHFSRTGTQLTLMDKVGPAMQGGSGRPETDDPRLEGLA
jgi:hypothetical protein